MKNSIFRFVSCAFAAILFSCSSDSVSRSSTTADTYVTGLKNGHACYWKNSQFVALPDAGFTRSAADSIVVENDNVHILGNGEAGTYKYLYWKNGIMSSLTDDFSTPTDVVVAVRSMDVSNGDVYFAGVTQNIAVLPNTYDLVYWKNGVKNIVSTFSMEYFSYSISIKVVNSDVYITSPQENAGVLTEGYYLNGTFFPSENAILWGCNAFNSEVYVFGRETENTGYYKNLSTNAATSFETISPICHMSFDGGNVYCSDAQNIYKDGILFYTLPVPSDFSGYYQMITFEVSNNATYVLTNIGNSNTGLLTQQLLINDNEIMHREEDEMFTSLFVVEN